MSGRVILYSGWYSPELCQSCPEMVFIFGDNLLGFGKGGQAIIRSEPNAYGVPTKRKPAMTESSFFVEGDEGDMDAVLGAIGGVWGFLQGGRDVIIPVTVDGEVSLGLERAQLKQRAPSIYDTIVMHVKEMIDGHGELQAKDDAGLRVLRISR